MNASSHTWTFAALQRTLAIDAIPRARRRFPGLRMWGERREHRRRHNDHRKRSAPVLTITLTIGIICAAIHAALTTDQRGSALEEGLTYFAASRGLASTRLNTWTPFDQEGMAHTLPLISLRSIELCIRSHSSVSP